jgi:uncharacterized protein (TIGR02246 family)
MKEGGSSNAEAKMVSVRVLTLVLAVGFAGAAHATEPAAGDRAAVQKIIADQVSAWNIGDATAFSRHLRPDIIMTNTVGMVAVGPAAFEAQHKLILSSIYKNSHLTETISHIRALSPTVIIVDVDASLAGSSWLAPGALIKDGTMFARLEQVFVKGSGGWDIASWHNVFVAKDQ